MKSKVIFISIGLRELNNEVSFGKYKGLTWRDVLYTQPTYIL
jgi:hypothetical protein